MMPYLPIDMIWEIFLRLPPKPLGCFRAVCHAWRDLATEHYLLLAHHHRQPSNLLIYCRSFAHRIPPCPLTYINFRVDALDLRARNIRPVVLFTEPTDPRPRIDSVLQIHGCCGGLLLISFTDNLACTERLDLCNPATHQWAPLSWIDTYKIAGLYQHGQDYRVLYHRGLGANKTYLIFSMASRQIRDIGCPVASKSDADAVAWLKRGPKPACWNPPVLLRGNLHWPPQSEESNTILVFDTVAETFRSMRTSIQPGVVSSLFDMDGTLAMSSRKNAKQHPVFVDLWLLQDYEMETWRHGCAATVSSSRRWRRGS